MNISSFPDLKTNKQNCNQINIYTSAKINTHHFTTQKINLKNSASPLCFEIFIIKTNQITYTSRPDLCTDTRGNQIPNVKAKVWIEEKKKQ